MSCVPYSSFIKKKSEAITTFVGRLIRFIYKKNFQSRKEGIQERRISGLEGYRKGEIRDWRQESSVVDPNTLKLDPDPGFWLNLDSDPDPGLYYQF